MATNYHIAAFALEGTEYCKWSERVQKVAAFVWRRVSDTGRQQMATQVHA
jgi:hypothetical protein